MRNVRKGRSLLTLQNLYFFDYQHYPTQAALQIKRAFYTEAKELFFN